MWQSLEHILVECSAECFRPQVCLLNGKITAYHITYTSYKRDALPHSTGMSHTPTTKSIANWLSHIETADTPISLRSYSPCSSRKRLKSPSPDYQQADVDRAHQRKRLQLQRLRLRESSGNAMNSPSNSNVSTTVLYSLDLPQLTLSQPPATLSTTPSTSKRKKPILDITNNVHNVRQNLAKNGMVFDDEDAFDACPKFKTYILELVGGSRASTMKEVSAKAIKRYLHANATQGEQDLFAKVVPMVMKDGKNGETSQKRNAEGEVFRQAETFGDDEGLHRVYNTQFIKNVLPRRLEQAGRKLGLTDRNPTIPLVYANPNTQTSLYQMSTAPSKRSLASCQSSSTPGSCSRTRAVNVPCPRPKTRPFAAAQH